MVAKKKMDWRDWKTWGTVLGVISTAYVLLGKIGGCFGAVEEVVTLPEKVNVLEERVDDGVKYQVIDSMTTASIQNQQEEMTKVLDGFSAQLTALMITTARLGEHVGVDVERADSESVK